MVGMVVVVVEWAVVVVVEVVSEPVN